MKNIFLLFFVAILSFSAIGHTESSMPTEKGIDNEDIDKLINRYKKMFDDRKRVIQLGSCSNINAAEEERINKTYDQARIITDKKEKLNQLRYATSLQEEFTKKIFEDCKKNRVEKKCDPSLDKNCTNDAPDTSVSYKKARSPIYPALSKRLGEHGTVVLRALVTAEGKAEKVEINKSSD
jgi:Fe-S cluster assembly scaffold protein SufB